ncbi:MAG TPA: hypothetical protein VFW21_01375 [Mycobacterium sp.]|nr:hypothetical protein [Mycobacterium sp.]
MARIKAPISDRQAVVDFWQPLESVGTVAAAGIAAWAAFQSRSSAKESNSAASQLTAIESQRRQSELCPQLRLTCERWGSGVDILRLRVALVGPPGLNRLDRLTAAIRNDHFRRGETHQEHMGGPTAEQVKAHIWGPYHFTPATGPDDARSDGTGRTTIYDTPIPTGEQLVYQLEHTLPGQWMTSMGQSDWIRQQGTLIRMAFTAEHNDYGVWYLPCEIETATLPVTVYVPLAPGDR